MKPIHLNLAARPYRDYRPVYAAVVVMSLVTAYLLLNNIETYYRYIRETKTTRAEIATIDLDASIAGIAPEIARAELEAAVADSLQRIRSRIDHVLRMAGLTPDAISAVFLTGGVTRMPSVQRSIAAAVPAARLIAGNVFGSVATGLALDAAKRFGSDDGKTG